MEEAKLQYANFEGFDISKLLAKEHQEIEEVQHWLDEHDPQRLEPATAKYREEIERLKAQQAKKEQPRETIVELCHRP